MERKLNHEKAVILIPRPGSRIDRLIAPGSGLVGVINRDRVVLFYEGNLFEASNMHAPEERVTCAFGRAATSYPTTAMAGLMPDETFDVIRVGEIIWPSEIRFDSPESKQLFDDYMSRYQSKSGSPSSTSGWYGSNMVEIDVRSFLGEYDDPRSLEDWRWIEDFASFSHIANDVGPGVFEFVMRVRKEDDDALPYESEPPARVKSVLDLAAKSGANWILFHQG